MSSMRHSPQFVYCELTNACNADCPACDFRRSRGVARLFMQRGTIEKVVSDVAALGAEVGLFSGEPMLHPLLDWFAERLNRASGRPVAHLSTNGQLLSRGSLKWEHFKSVGFSIDGLEPMASHIRGLKSQTLAVGQKLAGIIRARTAYGFPAIYMRIVVRPENYKRLAEYCDYWLSYPVDGVEVIHLHGTTEETAARTRAILPGFDAVARNPDFSARIGVDTLQLTRILNEIKRRFGARVSIIPDLEAEALVGFYSDASTFVGPLRFCSKPWDSLEVLASGRVVLSSNCVSLPLGDIHQSSLRELFCAPLLERFRAIMQERVRIPVCARCCTYSQSPSRPNERFHRNTGISSP